MGQFYRLELENSGAPDPYIEGSESTWFTVLPSSDVRNLGERVTEGDQVRLESTRWKWEVGFNEDQKPFVVKNTEETGPKKPASDNWSLSAAANWKLLTFSLDDDALIRLRRPEKKAAAPKEKEMVDEDGDGYADNFALASLESLSATSKFIRDGDLVRICASSRDDCFAVSSVFHPGIVYV